MNWVILFPVNLSVVDKGKLISPAMIIKLPISVFNSLFFLHAFESFVIEFIDIYDCYVFWMILSFIIYEISVFFSGNTFCLENFYLNLI